MEKMNNNMMHGNMMNEAMNHTISDEKMETVAGGNGYPQGVQVYYGIGAVVKAKIHGSNDWQIARITSSYYSREYSVCYCVELGSIGADGVFVANGKTTAVCYARLRTLD